MIVVHTKEVKNVTFSVDDSDLAKARQVAADRGTSLNEAFRQWLRNYAATQDDGASIEQLLARLSYARLGRKFTRDEMNER